ncbi:hypothetical protein KKG41_00015 [Patescibacteria group bacterium]|nr:hypothetical protein [Patescibacteria group bacterium]
MTGNIQQRISWLWLLVIHMVTWIPIASRLVYDYDDEEYGNIWIGCLISFLVLTLLFILIRQLKDKRFLWFFAIVIFIVGMIFNVQILRGDISDIDCENKVSEAYEKGISLDCGPGAFFISWFNEEMMTFRIVLIVVAMASILILWFKRYRRLKQ